MEKVPEEFMPLCPICQVKLGEDTFVVACGHTFHEDCIQAWRNKPNCDFCPICRHDLKGTEAKKLFFEFHFNESESNTADTEPEVEYPNPEEMVKKIHKENEKVLKKFKGKKIKKNKAVKKLENRLIQNTEELSLMKHVAVEVSKTQIKKNDLQVKINELQMEYNLKLQEFMEAEKFLQENQGISQNLEKLEKERKFLISELNIEDVMRRDRRAERKQNKRKKKRGVLKKLFGWAKRDKIEGPGF